MDLRISKIPEGENKTIEDIGSVYFPLFEMQEITSAVSRFKKPRSFLTRKARFSEIIDFLNKQKVLIGIHPTRNRNDLLPGVAFISIFSKNCIGWSANFTKKNKNREANIDNLSTSLGEGLERYFLANKESVGTEIISKKYSELKCFFEMVPKFLPEQRKLYPSLFNFKDEGEEFSVVSCFDLIAKKNTFIPCQYIFWQGKNSDEKLLVNPTTNGAGGYFTREGAILSGLYEELERDTFMLYWYSKKTPKRIDISTIDDEDTVYLINECTRRGIEVSVVKMENQYLMPVYGCVLLDSRSNVQAISFGSKLNPFNTSDAISSAITEAVVSLETNLNYKGGRFSIENVTDEDRLKINRNERISMWNGESIKNKIEFLLSGDFEKYTTSIYPEPSTEKKELSFILKILEKNNHKHVYVYEAPSPILKKIGFHVVKVIIPEVIQLNLHEFLVTFESERFAKILNKKTTKLKLNDFNKTPHPFP